MVKQNWACYSARRESAHLRVGGVTSGLVLGEVGAAQGTRAGLWTGCWQEEGWFCGCSCMSPQGGRAKAVMSSAQCKASSLVGWREECLHGNLAFVLRQHCGIVFYSVGL